MPLPAQAEATPAVNLIALWAKSKIPPAPAHSTTTSAAKKVPTSTPQPQPTPTKEVAQPTTRPPTGTPVPCSSTNDCVGYCAGIPNCSATCQNGHCVFTNPTINNSQCNAWGNWSGCISGQGACGGCAAQGYSCQTRSCASLSRLIRGCSGVVLTIRKSILANNRIYPYIWAINGYACAALYVSLSSLATQEEQVKGEGAG